MLHINVSLSVMLLASFLRLSFKVNKQWVRMPLSGPVSHYSSHTIFCKASMSCISRVHSVSKLRAIYLLHKSVCIYVCIYICLYSCIYVLPLIPDLNRNSCILPKYFTSYSLQYSCFYILQGQMTCIINLGIGLNWGEGELGIRIPPCLAVRT